MTTPVDRFMRRAFLLAERPVEAGDQDRDGDLSTLVADYRAEFGDGPNAAADWKAFLDTVQCRIRHEREPDLEEPGSAAAMVMRAVQAALDETQREGDMRLPHRPLELCDDPFDNAP